MAVNVLPLMRLVGALLIALGLVAGPAQAAQTIAQLGQSDGAARVETAAAAEWNNAKPFPKLKNGKASTKDANVYIKPEFVPKNDALLEAYSTDSAPKAKGAGIVVPGLLGIANQAYRAQNRNQAQKKKGKAGDPKYSLADAMRDAIWRKETAAKLRNLVR